MQQQQQQPQTPQNQNFWSDFDQHEFANSIHSCIQIELQDAENSLLTHLKNRIEKRNANRLYELFEEAQKELTVSMTQLAKLNSVGVFQEPPRRRKFKKLTLSSQESSLSFELVALSRQIELTRQKLQTLKREKTEMENTTRVVELNEIQLMPISTYVHLKVHSFGPLLEKYTDLEQRIQEYSTGFCPYNPKNVSILQKLNFHLDNKTIECQLSLF